MYEQLGHIVVWGSPLLFWSSRMRIFSGSDNSTLMIPAGRFIDSDGDRNREVMEEVINFRPIPLAVSRPSVGVDSLKRREKLLLLLIGAIAAAAVAPVVASSSSPPPPFSAVPPFYFSTSPLYSVFFCFFAACWLRRLPFRWPFCWPNSPPTSPLPAFYIPPIGLPFPSSVPPPLLIPLPQFPASPPPPYAVSSLVSGTEEGEESCRPLLPTAGGEKWMEGKGKGRCVEEEGEDEGRRRGIHAKGRIKGSGGLKD
jgi:hypothetical protein